jgi:hypothetical protein
MNELLFAELSAWLTQAGLSGTSETNIVSSFCEQVVAAGLPLDRTVVFIDTLHPVHEGGYSAGGMTPRKLLSSNMAAPARTASPPVVLIQRTFRPPRAGGTAHPSTGCSKLVTRCCAVA